MTYRRPHVLTQYTRQEKTRALIAALGVFVFGLVMLALVITAGPA